MGDERGLRDRVRDRMAAEGIPIGTDDPTLLALGAAPLCGVIGCGGDPCRIQTDVPDTPTFVAYDRGCARINRLVDGPGWRPVPEPGTPENPVHLGGALINFPAQAPKRPCPSRATAVLMMVDGPADVRCGLLEGHAGPHMVRMEWTGDPQTFGSTDGET